MWVAVVSSDPAVEVVDVSLWGGTITSLDVGCFLLVLHLLLLFVVRPDEVSRVLDAVVLGGQKVDGGLGVLLPVENKRNVSFSKIRN